MASAAMTPTRTTTIMASMSVKPRDRRTKPMLPHHSSSGRWSALAPASGSFTHMWGSCSRAIAAVMLALAAALGGGATGCTCAHGVSKADAARDFGEVGAPAPDVVASAAYLAMARAVLEHRPAPTGADLPAPGPGRRVVLAMYPPAGEP